jgi:putative ABC transport system permease protein
MANWGHGPGLISESAVKEATMEIRPLLSAMWRKRSGPFLVAAQVAITLMVLVNCAYIVEQRFATNRKPTGVDIENIFWIVTEGYGADYNHAVSVATDLAYLNSLPGVVAATTSGAMPQTFDRLVLPLSTEPQSKGRQEMGVTYTLGEKGIDTLGVRLIAGRSYSPETVAPPVSNVNASIGNWAPEVVITNALATKLYPNGDALGKTVYVGIINRESKIVGVVERLQAAPIAPPKEFLAENVILVPIILAGPKARYLVRTTPGNRDSVMSKVEKELGPTQQGRLIDEMGTLQDTATRTRAPSQVSAIILMIVALLVLAVTAIGIFGLAAFNVTARTKQIGIRRAIGARKYHIVRYFLVEHWIINTAGVVAGCALALGFGVKLSLMFQMPRLPLMYLVGGVLALWLVGLFAAVIPARRAASISPAIATRTV